MLNGDDMGEVNIFGLDEYGMPAGISPLWGLGVGVALSSGVPAVLRMTVKTPTSKLLKYDEAIGAAAGTVAGGVMMFFKGSRYAGLTGLITSLGTAGVRALEKALMSDTEKANLALSMIASLTDKTAAKAAVAALAGIEISQVPSLQGMEIQQVPSLQGPGMVPTLLGGPGNQASGPTFPPQLLGASQAALQGAGAQQMAQAGLQLNGLGRSYGYSPVYGNG
jgi:hypothetical protein